MKLNEAQQKLSSDIAQLHETYELISKNKTRFTDLDVALLQQQLLFIYHSLLRLQNEINTNGVVAAPLIETTVNQEEISSAIETEIIVASKLETTPEIVELPDAIDENTVEIARENIKNEQTAFEPISLFSEINTSVSKLNNITENEPTIEDLEAMAELDETTIDTSIAVEEEDNPKIEEKVQVTPQPDILPTIQLTIPAVTPVVTELSGELSLLDKLTATVKTPDVYEKITKEQQQSLKQAINLNKKIAFVNNLFNENTVEYAKAIEKLNTSSSLHESLRYFNELKHQYNWNNENALVKDLEQLIEKRFA